MTSADETKTDSSATVRLLEMTVRLLGVIAVRGLPQTQQIALLSRAGFSPKEIAGLLNTTANTVRVSLVAIRKAEKVGKGPLKLNRKEQADEEEL
jgi:hypothetical protein